MIPKAQGDSVFINGDRALRLIRSDGRPGSTGDGFVMWSSDGRPFGWVNDGECLIDCVVASKLLNGELAPQWQTTPEGYSLVHPRYTLRIKESNGCFIPTITDETTQRCHRLAPRKTAHEAIYALEELLRRRLGRTMPSLHYYLWLERPLNTCSPLQLAERAIAPEIESFAKYKKVCPTPSVGHAQLIELAAFFDKTIGSHFDPLPYLATVVASRIKSSFLKLYRGRTAMGGLAAVELKTFRDHFRRRPYTDEEYLHFVNSNLIVPLRRMRKKSRERLFPRANPLASKKSYQPHLHPRRDRGDFPMVLPLPAGERLFEAAGDVTS
jgi:hypothetical protein